MNYPEYVLRRSETLWETMEEAWQRELTTAAGVMRGSGADAGTAEGESAAKRLAEKIFPTDGETAAEAVQRLAEQERGIRGENGTRWLAQELGRSTAEGVVPERRQEREAAFAPVCETADLQTLSQSVERDARRYDGGFLLY